MCKVSFDLCTRMSITDIVPFDGSPITELRGVLLPLFIYLYVLATAGIILAIACAIVNIALRKRK